MKSEIQTTGDDFKVVSLGQIQITETGNKVLTVTPEKENWNEIELMKVVLVK
jgi:hypothetical protein